MDRERAGLIFAGLCAVNGAFVPAFAKLTTNLGDSVFVAMVTTGFAAVIAAIVLAAQGQLGYLVRPRVGPRLMIVGALGTAVAFILFYAGARRSSAIETVLCLQSEPAYSLLCSWWALGHRPTLRRALAILVILSGIALAVGARGLAFSPGVWMLLVTPLCWQLSHLLVLRALVGVPPQVLTGARYVYGVVFLFAYWVLSGGLQSIPAPDQLRALLPLLAMQGFVLSYVGTLLWYQAITRLDLTRGTAIVVPSIPVLSLGASFLLLGEIPTVPQCLGLMLTASGVIAFVTAPQATRA